MLLREEKGSVQEFASPAPDENSMRLDGSSVVAGDIEEFLECEFLRSEAD
jgi:hypothetical protein